jgi:hypothetical protein
MKRSTPSLLVLAFLAAASPSGAAGEVTPGELPLHQAEDPGAPVVTEGNLLASERFWPYRVALVRPWSVPGREQPIDPGTLGVLIRVEAGGVARLDFGRDGLHEVPIAETDLLDRANQVRRGEIDKMAPNLVLAIGPRLLDPGSTPLRPIGMVAASRAAGFLCVFADPAAPDFAELVASLEPLRGREGVTTVLLPQGEHRDGEVAERIRSLGWAVPFMYDRYSEPYRRSLLREGTGLPAILLATREGRVLFQDGWSAEVVPQLGAAWEKGFAGAPE